MKTKILLSIFLSLIYLSANSQNGIYFSFTVDGRILETNTIQYKSEFGLEYQVSQIQFFVSNIGVIKNGQKIIVPNSVHYVDIDIPETLSWVPSEDFFVEDADSLFFTFGLDSVANKSYRFRNPPENAMFWPDYLGGGYHYLKLNILYKDFDGNYNAFNCHLGRGQVYDSENEPVSYIENSFEVKLPVEKMQFLKNVKNSPRFCCVNLQVDRVFDNPTPVNFMDYGGIMNNQEAMSLFIGNLKGAFRNFFQCPY